MRDSYVVEAPELIAEYKIVANPQKEVACQGEYEILFVSDGLGKCIVEGVEYRIEPRTLLLFRPLEYRVSVMDETVPYERYSFRFTESALSEEYSELLRSLLGASTGMGNYYSNNAVPLTVVSVFERIKIAETLPEKQRKQYLSLLLSELLVILSASEGEQMVNECAELGTLIIEYLNTFIDKNISLDRIARRFFISKYHLCRIFKEYSGVSVHAYIRHKRIMYAKQLIDSGETAQRAADAAGFGDYSAFYRAYVKIVGKNPSSKSSGREGDVCPILFLKR